MPNAHSAQYLRSSTSFLDLVPRLKTLLIACYKVNCACAREGALGYWLRSFKVRRITSRETPWGAP